MFVVLKKINRDTSFYSKSNFLLYVTVGVEMAVSCDNKMKCKYIALIYCVNIFVKEYY